MPQAANLVDLQTDSLGELDRERSEDLPFRCGQRLPSEFLQYVCPAIRGQRLGERVESIGRHAWLNGLTYTFFRRRPAAFHQVSEDTVLVNPRKLTKKVHRSDLNRFRKEIRDPNQGFDCCSPNFTSVIQQVRVDFKQRAQVPRAMACVYHLLNPLLAAACQQPVGSVVYVHTLCPSSAEESRGP